MKNAKHAFQPKMILEVTPQRAEPGNGGQGKEAMLLLWRDVGRKLRPAPQVSGLPRPPSFSSEVVTLTSPYNRGSLHHGLLPEVRMSCGTSTFMFLVRSQGPNNGLEGPEPARKY